MSLVYLDTETTGLDPMRHEVWEVAWAVDDGPVASTVLHHSLRHAHPAALSINRYHERPHAAGVAEAVREMDLMGDLRGATLVGANPAFDAKFLEARWGEAPWHYRLFDIEAYGAAALDLDRPCGLKDLTSRLVALGYDIPAPDHSAAGDVATLRAVHVALRDARLNIPIHTLKEAHARV